MIFVRNLPEIRLPSSDVNRCNTQVGAPQADPQNIDSAGIVYVVFGWQSSEEDRSWDDTVDITALDGSNGFLMTGSTSNGHFGYVVTSVPACAVS